MERAAKDKKDGPPVLSGIPTSSLSNQNETGAGRFRVRRPLFFVSGTWSEKIINLKTPKEVQENKPEV